MSKATIDFSEFTTDEMRHLCGQALKELKRRAAIARGEDPDAPKPAKVSTPKAPVAPREIGVKCTTTGKVLKRRFEDAAAAALAAADLTTSMKRPYEVINVVTGAALAA